MALTALMVFGRRAMRLRLRWWMVIPLAVAGTALAIWLWLFRGLPAVDRLEEYQVIPSIRITDRSGRLLYEVIGAEAGRHSVVALDEIPLYCRQATIATEDARFYSNPGVDLRAVLRAGWQAVRGGEISSGASTITQQVVRGLLLDPDERTERTLRRKLREMILAYRLNRQFSKDEILALYLNNTYYGNLAYGIDAAARAYFSKPVANLSLAECALLAGLPQAPALYDPLSDPDAAHDRQAVVLRLMQENGLIDAEQAEVAAREPLQYAADRYSIRAPHFVTAAYAELLRVLPSEVVERGGLVVRTTLNLDWQDTAERIARRQLASLNTPRRDEPPHNVRNAALVALDPHSGQVLAMLGSPDYFDASISGAINLAMVPRQPGSTLKPFTYALAFDPARADPWSPATMLLDVRTTFITREGQPYTPINYDHVEHGPVLIREALASSYNIPAVVALDKVGITNLIRLLHRLGITTLTDPNKYDLALTLGGGEVRLLDLTAAYAALANGGGAVQPQLLLEVHDAQGKLLYRAPGPRVSQVIDPRVAWLITDILSDNYARAPAFTDHSVLQIGRPAAVKTGTTTDFRDNWTVGYTPDLVVGVWVGNASNERMVSTSGVTGAGPIWHDFMREVLRGRPERGFERPDGLVRLEVCSLSGLLPTPDCPYTRLEWFIAGTQPDKPDNLYVHAVDPLTNQPHVYLDLPPQAHDWARSLGLPLLADSLASSPSAGSDTALVALSPAEGAVFRLDPTRPLDAQKLRLAVAGPQTVQRVVFAIDGIEVALDDSPPFEAWWLLAEGDHVLTVRAAMADGSEQTLTVHFRVNAG